MILKFRFTASLLFFLLSVGSIFCQQPDVPQVFRYTYTIPIAERIGVQHPLSITARIYTNDLGGSPIWVEHFDLTPDSNWRVSMFLGSSGGTGLPSSIFAYNAARWISVQLEGFDESGRAALISVPYALKARDADTLGGLPASAFLTAPIQSATISDNNSRMTTTGSATYTSISPGALNLVPKYINSTDLGGSQITDTGLGVGVGTGSPQEMLDVQGRAILRTSSRGPAGLWLGSNDTNSAFVGLGTTTANSPMVLSHGGLPRVTITQAGRVGIGVDAPTSALDVNGDIHLSSGALYFSDGTWMKTAGVASGGTTSIAAADSSITLGSSNGSTTIAVTDQGITSAKLADGSVNTLKIADGSITSSKFASGSLSGLATLAQNNFSAEQTVRISSPTTHGISSYNTATTGSAIAIFGKTSSTSGLAIKAHNSATTGQSTAVYASSESTTGYGVFSVANASTGYNYGVYGQSRSTSGTGVMGETVTTTGTTYGVYGETAGANYSAGVYGIAASTTASSTHYGVYGKANGIYGIGVIGYASNTAISNGAPIGVLGRTVSPLGVGGQFVNAASSGNVIVGQNDTGNVWRVDNAGNEYLKGTVNTGGADFAEAIEPAEMSLHFEPGDVLAISTMGDRQVDLAREAYSTRVIGVYATKPGILASRKGIVVSESEIPVAMIGIVPAKASAENGPIMRGDLLVSASTAGHVMRATDRDRTTGAVVGKAMQALESGTGVIEIAVTLQ